VCIGADNCIKVLVGKGVGRRNDKCSQSSDFKHVDVFSNFKQYGFPMPEILRMDADCLLFKKALLFDAIICDPPYGRRAQLKQKPDSQLSKRKPEIKEIDHSEVDLNKAREMDSCLESVYALSRLSLKQNGRLVLLFHMNNTDDFDKVFPLTAGFTVVNKSINGLTKDRCRVLVTLIKFDSNC
jgi:tRNA G10  N-methylase Trm11